MRERWTTYCLKQLRENLLICTIILSSPILLQKGYIDKLMNFFQQTDSCRWSWGCVLVHWSDCLHATCFIKYINTLWCDALQWGNSVVAIPPLHTKLLTSWAMQLGRCSPSRSASKNQACKVRVYCAIAQWFEVCLYLVLCCVVDSNPYQLSCPGSSVGWVLSGLQSVVGSNPTQSSFPEKK